MTLARFDIAQSHSASTMASQRKVSPGARRAFAAAVVLIVLTGTTWIVVHAMQPPALAIASQMPAIAYRAASDSSTLVPARNQPTLVVFFHTACEYCTQEFARLNADTARLAGAAVYLLSPEKSLDFAGMKRRWPALTAASNVIVGSVAAGEFEKSFGTLLTPAHFVFDAEGRLVDRVVGLVDAGRLLARHRTAPPSY
jgi:peroxiredoxin